MLGPEVGRTHGRQTAGHVVLRRLYVPSSGHFPLFLQLNHGFGLYNGAEATVSNPGVTLHTPPATDC